MRDDKCAFSRIDERADPSKWDPGEDQLSHVSSVS